MDACLHQFPASIENGDKGAGYQHGQDPDHRGISNTQNFPHRVDDGHDTHIDIPAKALQRNVADNLYHTVGGLHDKPGKPKSQNVFHICDLQLHTLCPESEKGPPACQEPHDPQG